MKAFVFLFLLALFGCYKVTQGYRHLKPIITYPRIPGKYELVTGETLQIKCHVNKILSQYDNYPIHMWWCNSSNPSCLTSTNPKACKLCIHRTSSDFEAAWFSTNLTIENVTSTDASNYFCVAYTEDESYKPSGPGASSITIDVKDKFGPKLTVKPTQNITKTVGRNLELVCVDEGYPTPAVSWYKNGDFIHEGRLLKFWNVSKMDISWYHCAVANRFDRIHSSAIFLQVEDEEKYIYTVVYIVASCCLGTLIPILIACLVYNIKCKYSTSSGNPERIQSQSEEEEQLIN